MDEDTASRFVSSLVKSIQALCNGYIDFSSSIEVVGHIHLNIDRNTKLDYVLTEEVSKSISEGSTVFASHSYHSQPPPSVLPSPKSASASSNRSRQKVSRTDNSDPIGLTSLPHEVPNSLKSDSHSHSSNRLGDSDSSHSGNTSSQGSDFVKQENSRLSCQMQDSVEKRRRSALTSQRMPSPAAKRSRDDSSSKSAAQDPGFDVIEIKEEPDDEPSVYFGDNSSHLAAGQDIQTPDFSNVVMESLDRVSQLEGTHLLAGSGGDGMQMQQQPFPISLHTSAGMPSSSAGPVPGPSDPQSAASTSGGFLSSHGLVSNPESMTGTASQDSQHHQTHSQIHFLQHIPVTRRKIHPTRRCVVCKHKGNRRESRFFCSSCPGFLPSYGLVSNPESMTGTASQNSRLQQTQRHCLQHIPVTGKKMHPQRRCIVCKQKGIRRESRFFCSSCSGHPGFCRTEHCFEQRLQKGSPKWRSLRGQNCVKKDLKSPPTSLTALGHVLEKGEGRNHHCAVCERCYSQFRTEHRDKLDTDNPFKRSKTPFRCRMCRVYLCAPDLKLKQCWWMWHQGLQ